MADAGALRGPAVAGHAGAVVEHIGDVQLHVSRLTLANPRRSRETEVRRVSNLSLLLPLSRRSSERNAASASESGSRSSRILMNVRGTRRRHARITDPFARNCVKLHPMTHIVGEYLARVRQTVQARGESRGLSSARMTSWVIPGRPIAAKLPVAAAVPCRDVR